MSLLLRKRRLKQADPVDRRVGRVQKKQHDCYTLPKNDLGGVGCPHFVEPNLTFGAPGLYRMRNLPQIFQGVFSTKSGHPTPLFWGDIVMQYVIFCVLEYCIMIMKIIQHSIVCVLENNNDNSIFYLLQDKHNSGYNSLI